MRSLTLLFLLLLACPCLHAQDTEEPPPGKAYWTASGEWIFSVPILDVNGNEQGAVVRFSPFFNVQWMLNYDLGRHAGLFTGLSVRNQGFIYQLPDTAVRYKYRTYDVGIPLGLKLGTMNHTLFYVGYEVELPFNYKEKRFENEKKVDKFNVWLSDRTEPFFQSVFVGFQGPGRSDLTVRYYLTNFHNTDFTETTDGVTTKPYAGLNANILSFSLGYALFDATKMRHHLGADRSVHDVHAMR